MTKTPVIAVFGSVHMDLIAHAHHLPETGTSGLAHGFTLGMGGKGGNQAAECATAGARSCMVTRLGDDDFGRQLLSALASRGVDCSRIDVRTASQSGASTVLSAPEGYTSLIFPGAAATLTMGEVASRIGSFDRLDMLLLQQELPIGLSLAAARAARAKGARVVLNASPPSDNASDLRDLLAICDIVVVNAEEARTLAGSSNSLEAAQKLNTRIVITLGAEGSEASDGVERWRQPAIPVSVRSTVGAGDAFLAGLCVALSEGLGMPAALKAAAKRAAARLRAN